MATVTTTTYGTKTSITMDLANLASSSTLVAGVESAEISNATNMYVDVLVQGKVYPGTTPTASTSIYVYVWGSDATAASVNLDVIDGTTSAETISKAGVRDGFLKLGAFVTLSDTTSNQEHPIAPFSVAQLFGGVMPKYWGLFVTHNTGVAMYNNAVNTNAFSYTGITYTST